MTGASLILYDEARRALADIVRVDEAKALRDKAQALEAYARQAKDDELLAGAIEVRIRAERRAGELLADMARRGERRHVGRPKQYPADTILPALADLGVTNLQSSRWQALAALDKADFDARVAARKAQAQAAVELSRAEKQEAKRAARAEKERALGAQQRALPARRYGVIYADIEARFEPFSRDSGMDRAPENHYPTSDWRAIEARDVASIAAPDCALFLWAWMPNLPQCLGVLTAWGFAYKSHAVWVKDRVGPGYWFRAQHELLLVGTRGDMPAPAMGDQFPSVINAPRGAHSAKPERVLEMIEAYFPTLPKIELNRRGPPRPGWDAWGNEADVFEEQTT